MKANETPEEALLWELLTDYDIGFLEYKCAIWTIPAEVFII